MKAAGLLIDNEYHTESVHCAYYGCLLLMKHLLNRSGAAPYEVQDGARGDSHQWILTEIKKKIANVVERTEVDKAFLFLKKERIKADYRQYVFNRLESKSVFERSMKLQNKLQSLFNYEKEKN